VAFDRRIDRLGCRLKEGGPGRGEIRRLQPLGQARFLFEDLQIHLDRPVESTLLVQNPQQPATEQLATIQFALRGCQGLLQEPLVVGGRPLDVPVTLLLFGQVEQPPVGDLQVVNFFDRPDGFPRRRHPILDLPAAEGGDFDVDGRRFARQTNDVGAGCGDGQ